MQMQSMMSSADTLMWNGFILFILNFVVNEVKSLLQPVYLFFTSLFVTRMSLDVVRSSSMNVHLEKMRKEGRAWFIGSVRTNINYVDVKSMKTTAQAGTYVFFHNWHLITATFRVSNDQGGQVRAFADQSMCDLTGFFVPVKEMKRFVRGFMNVSKTSDKTIDIFENQAGYWTKSVSKPQRPFDSVIFPASSMKSDMNGVAVESSSESVAHDILRDINEFIDSKEWYKSKGIPYRRCFLIQSPPGSGKSSYIQALAGALNRDIYYMSLNEKGLTDSTFARSLRQTSDKSIVLIEDIDVAFPVKRTDKVAKSAAGQIANKMSTLTMSGFLNAMDGMLAPEGKILFLTTNHIENLDPALIRPGRVDRVITMSYATKEQIAKMCDRFLGEEHKDLKELVIQMVPENYVSMAELQSLFIRCKSDYTKLREQVFLFVLEVRDERALQKKRKEEEERKEKEQLEDAKNKGEPDETTAPCETMLPFFGTAEDLTAFLNATQTNPAQFMGGSGSRC
jgi:hypothetical protein